MSSTEPFFDTLRLEAENIGGINETDIQLSKGVTILESKNATNRTSFLQAVMASMGSDEFNLKDDAEHGCVRLTLGDTVVEREFNRRNGLVESTSEGYLNDPELADLFAFLMETNESRQAVARGENLRELIVRRLVDEATAQWCYNTTTVSDASEYPFIDPVSITLIPFVVRKQTERRKLGRDN